MESVLLNILAAIAGTVLSPVIIKAGKLESRWVKRDIVSPLNTINAIIVSLISILVSLVITSGSIFPVSFLVALAISTLLFASLADWYSCKIPNELLIIAGIASILGFTIEIAFSFMGLTEETISLSDFTILGISMAFILIATTITNFITKGKLGTGDVKLLLTLGLLSYWATPISVFYGIMIAFFIQLILRKVWISQQEDKTIKGAPFGAALTLGCIVAFSFL